MGRDGFGDDGGGGLVVEIVGQVEKHLTSPHSNPWQAGNGNPVFAGDWPVAI